MAAANEPENYDMPGFGSYRGGLGAFASAGARLAGRAYVTANRRRR